MPPSICGSNRCRVFAASRSGATEDLLSTSRRAGLGSPARLVLADLARSAAASTEAVDPIMGGAGVLGGPSLGALAASSAPRRRDPALVDLHRRAGARFVECDGWNDVAHYGDIDRERHALATTVGLRDLSCQGWYHVAGPGAATVLQQLLDRPVAEDAIDDLVELGDRQLVRVGPAAWELAVSVGQATLMETELVAARLGRQPWEVVVTPRHEDAVRVRLLGPATPDLLDGLAIVAPIGRRHPVTLGELAAYCLAHHDHDVELHVGADAGRALWAALLVAGERLSICPVGLDAFASHRLGPAPLEGAR